MPNRYSNSMNLFLLATFYAPILPIGLAIGFVGNMYSYWVDKCLLLRRHKVPEQMGSTMAKFFANFIPWCLIPFGVSNYTTWNRLGSGFNAARFAFIWIVIVSIFLPIRTCINKMCTGKADKSSDETYEKHKNAFQFDYERDNPMTQKEA